MIKGYDISNVNGPISIPGDAEFIIAKASQDAQFDDKYYEGFRDVSRQLEIGFGGYHYGDPQEQPNARDSVKFFLDKRGDQQDGEVSALDVEQDSGSGGFIVINPNNRKWVLDWGDEFTKLENYKPKLYVSKSGLSDFDLLSEDIPEYYDLWYAYWTINGGFTGPPLAPLPFTSYQLWQYNADEIDKDVFLGTLAEFRATGKKSAPQPPPDGADYEAFYWTPIQRLLDACAASGEHADVAFHAAASNLITMHKIARGVEPIR